MATIGQPLTAPEDGWKRYDITNTDTNFITSGTWTQNVNNSFYDKTQFSSAVANSKVMFSFKGTKIRIISYITTSGATDSKITIDGATENLVINYTNGTYQALAYEKLNLPNGYHTVEISKGTGTTTLALDAIDIDDTGRLGSPINKFLIQLSDGNVLSVKSGEEYSTITTMTSNESSIGEIIYSTVSGDFFPFYAFDNNIKTRWMSSAVTGYIGFKYSQKIKLTKYRIIPMSKNNVYNPKSWTFEGSNNGSTWDILDRQTYYSFLSQDGDSFILTNQNDYLFYKLNVTLNDGGTSVGLVGLELYSEKPDYPVYLESINEQNFIGSGIDKLTYVDLDLQNNKKQFVKQSRDALGSGNVFICKIDTSKIPIKKVSIT